LVSGSVGFGSFLTYLGHGYLDTWHAIATLLLLPWFAVGLAGSFRHLGGPRRLRDAWSRLGARDVSGLSWQAAQCCV
jgi:hypothetical protein